MDVSMQTSKENMRFTSCIPFREDSFRSSITNICQLRFICPLKSEFRMSFNLK